MDNKNFIAKRVALMLNDGDVINLGIGLPTLVANHIPAGINVTCHAENGIIGSGGHAEPGHEDFNVFDAGGMYINTVPGATYIHSADSFGIIRGGHINATILGALQVDEKGNLANWTVPGKKVTGMGGAMDLVASAKLVICAMEHTAKGNPKILKECTFPLTGAGVVDLIVTEMGVIRVTESGLVLEEIAAGYTVEQVQAATGAELKAADDLKVIQFCD
ncbi:MAG: 3-oxoacid CoA-transferase subunit B [Clostridia bacterium]|nr:3-oxoacid CoA-transferase subunit B [Clostridia bacterium]